MMEFLLNIDLRQNKMWMFWTLIVVEIIVAIALSIWIYERFTDKGYHSLAEWVVLHKKRILIPYAVMLALTLWWLRMPLWYTSSCWYDSYAYNTQTEYNWIKAQCLYTGKNGSKLPLWNTRDIPDGKDHSDPTPPDSTLTQ